MVHNPRPLTERERQLLNQFVNCQLQITPMEFYSKWDVNYQEIAEICKCDISLVSRWFSPQYWRSPPLPHHLWYLALADRFLELYARLPPELQQQICRDREPS
ncbi:MAG: helix-turn-helix domain-containing protein [Limnoraphis robusta]